MWKNIVEQGRAQMTIWRMRIAWWIPKATGTHSVCVILTAFPLKRTIARLRLNVTLDIVCLVLPSSNCYRCLLHLIDLVC